MNSDVAEENHYFSMHIMWISIICHDVRGFERLFSSSLFDKDALLEQISKLLSVSEY